MEMEGGRSCPNCGKPVPAETTLCPSCGKSLPPLPVLTGAKSPITERTVSGSGVGDSVLGIVASGATPFLVGLLGGGLGHLIAGPNGELLSAGVLVTIPLSLAAFAIVYFSLRKRLPVFARVYGITALVQIVIFPLGMLSNCFGVLAGQWVTGGFH